jgi:hypothetical protein
LINISSQTNTVRGERIKFHLFNHSGLIILGFLPNFTSSPRVLSNFTSSPEFSPGTHKAHVCNEAGCRLIKSSGSKFEPATCRLIVVRPTTLGKMVVYMCMNPTPPHRGFICAHLPQICVDASCDCLFLAWTCLI